MARVADGFWGERLELEDGDFAWVEAGDHDPDDSLDRDTWRHIVVLPDDVAIRTTRQQGTVVRRTCDIAEQWGYLCGFFTLVRGGPKRAAADTLFHLGEELEASIYFCVTGWYRQAFGSLRTSFELGLAGPYFDLAQRGEYRGWKHPHGSVPTPGGSKACRALGSVPFLAQAAASIRASSLFAERGWLQTHYRYLSDFAHARPQARGGRTAPSMASQNILIWNSNGPVYRPDAVELWAVAFAHTACALAALAGLAYPPLPSIKGPWDDTTWAGYSRNLLALAGGQPTWAAAVIESW